MARINLLPWRAERRKQRQREFQGMLGMAALGGVVLSLLVWFHFDRQIAGQHQRNTFLQAEIDKVKKQNEEIKELDTKKDRLLARKKVIEELQANRSQMVHLFDSLVRTIPDGVTLASIKQEGDMLTLHGSAQSNARVSAYLRSLETSGWMTKPELSIIEVKKNERASAAPSGRMLPYAFSLKVLLANPNTDEAAEGVLPGPGDPEPAAAAADAADLAADPAAIGEAAAEAGADAGATRAAAAADAAPPTEAGSDAADAAGPAPEAATDNPPTEQPAAQAQGRPAS